MLPRTCLGVFCLALSWQSNALETQQQLQARTQANLYDTLNGVGSYQTTLLSGLYRCDTAIKEAMLLSAVCSLACRTDQYDVSFGAGACHDLIAQGLTCAGDFGVTGQYKGYCDISCGFCDAEVSASLSVAVVGDGDWLDAEVRSIASPAWASLCATHPPRGL